MKHIILVHKAIVIIFIFLSSVIASDYPAVSTQHPRVFITPSDISDLQSKKDDPEFQSLWNEIVNLSNSHFLSAALVYLVDGNTTKGTWAVSKALAAVQNKPSASDAINKSSNIMNRAVCVYDWCYDLLSETQKNSFIMEFERLANTEAPGYPADYNPYSIIVGHIAESNVQLSQLIAGCAIYDESQTMWDAAIALHWDKFIPARNLLYKMHMYWQGDSYVGRFINDSYNAWFYRKLGHGDVYISDMQYVPYGTVYSTRPDGRQFKRGDRYDEKGNAGKKGPIYRAMAMYWDNPYLATLGDDSWYAYYASSNDGSHDMEKVFEFVFRPSNLKKAPISELPLTKYFPDPMGEMIARTGWDWLDEESNDAVITMEFGGCDFKGHTNPGHFGGFQIYYKGALAISTGCYQNKTDHDNNYHEKSQSHNVLLILDPNEDMTFGTGGTNTANDGGQICPPLSWGTYESKPKDCNDLLARYRKAYVTGYQFGPDSLTPEYSYIGGDLTPAYSNQPTPKVSDVRRHMVTLNHFNEKYPATLIILDWIISTNPSFKKTWQIHCIEEPSINPNGITIRRTARHYSNGPSGGQGNYSGKLILKNLLPADALIQKIGGEGYDCWVEYEDMNYPPDPQAANYDNENGEWRVEISPETENLEDFFLNVMTVMDDTTSYMPVVEMIETDRLVGVKIIDRVVCFSKYGAELSGQISMTVPGYDDVKVLVCNLEPGIWEVRRNGETVITQTVSEGGKSIYFSISPGDYILSNTENLISQNIDENNQFKLFQNYPNPFNSTTTIEYEIFIESKINIAIYDINGRLVKNLLDQKMAPGSHSIQWEASETGSGVFFYKIQSGDYIKVLKCILIK